MYMYIYVYIYIYIYAHTHIYRIIHKPLRDFRPLQYSSRDSHVAGEHVNRLRDTPPLPHTHTCNVCGRNLITGLTSTASPKVEISSTCKVGKKLGVSLPLLTCTLRRDHPGYCTAEVGISRRDLWIILYIYIFCLNKRAINFISL